MCLLMVTDLHRDAERFEVLSPFVRESHHISICVCFSSPYRSITGSLNVLWFTAWALPVAWHEVQARGEFDLHKLKTEIGFPTTLPFVGWGGIMQNRCIFQYSTVSSGSCPWLWVHEGCSSPISHMWSSRWWNHRARASLSLAPETYDSALIISFLIPKGSQSAQNTTLRNIYCERFLWLGSFDGNISLSGIFGTEIHAQVLHSISAARSHEAGGSTKTL